MRRPLHGWARGPGIACAMLALALAGCEGELSIGEGLPLLDGALSNARDASPTNERDGGWDDAGTDPDRDAGPLRLDGGPALDGGPGLDAGPPAVDAGPPALDAGPPRLDAGPPGCGTAVEQEELRLTNAARASAGLGALACDEALTRAARLHSQDMCDQGYFSHTSLDGRTFRNRIDAQGVSWSTIGENIARGQRTAADVHAAWMASTGHRANILNGAFGRIGIGYVECPGSGPYWTQDFAN